MEASREDSSKNRNNAVVKALIFLAFIVVAITVVSFTPVKNYFTAEALGNFLNTAGFGRRWFSW